jgi:hypothetical protein
MTGPPAGSWAERKPDVDALRIAVPGFPKMACAIMSGPSLADRAKTCHRRQNRLAEGGLAQFFGL